MRRPGIKHQISQQRCRRSKIKLSKLANSKIIFSVYFHRTPKHNLTPDFQLKIRSALLILRLRANCSTKHKMSPQRKSL